MALNKNINLQYSDGGKSTPKTGGLMSGATFGGLGISKANIVNTGKDRPTGGSKSGSSSSTSGGGFDLASYYSSLAAQGQAAADAAYENNMARIAEMYNNVAGNLGSNYNSAVSRLKAARDRSLKDVNTDAENSLRQAYINNELTKRNLNQRLSAMGYNGGATESTMADLANEYSRSRGGINTTRNTNIADLNQQYSDNLAAALQAYNSAMNNLEMQRMSLENAAENARANAASSGVSGSLSVDSGYITALQNALQKQAAYQYDPTQATNDYVAGNVTQAQSTPESTNYAKWLQEAQQLANSGNASGIQNMLFGAIRNGDLDLNAAYRIMNSFSR